jgi:hypothetical protein
MTREGENFGFISKKSVLKEEMRMDVWVSGEDKWAALSCRVNAVDQANRLKNSYYDFRNWGYDVMVQEFTFPKNGTDTVEVIKRAMSVEPIRKI